MWGLGRIAQMWLQERNSRWGLSDRGEIYFLCPPPVKDVYDPSASHHVSHIRHSRWVRLLLGALRPLQKQE